MNAQENKTKKIYKIKFSSEYIAEVIVVLLFLSTQNVGEVINLF